MCASVYPEHSKPSRAVCLGPRHLRAGDEARVFTFVSTTTIFDNARPCTEESVQRKKQRSTSFQHLSISCGYRPRVLTFQFISTSISPTRITIASKAILRLPSCSPPKSTQVCPRYVSAHSSRLKSASCTQRKNLALPLARCMRPPSTIPS